MQTPLYLLFSLFVVSNSQSSLPWMSLMANRGSSFTLLEAFPRVEYHLRPQPILTVAKGATNCLTVSSIELEVSLWTSGRLRDARRSLFEIGRCKSTDACRVLPLAVERFGFRDQMSQWHAESPWVFVSGTLPSSHRFKLHRKPQSRYEGSDCQLRSLVMDIVLMNPPSAYRMPLVFTSADVDWAVRVLGISPTTGSVIAVDKRRLRLLSRSLIKMKLETLESIDERVSLKLTPAAMKTVQLALISRTVRYGVFKRAFNKTIRGYRRLLDIEPVYILKKLSALRPFEVKLPSSSRALNMVSISLNHKESNPILGPGSVKARAKALSRATEKVPRTTLPTKTAVVSSTSKSQPHSDAQATSSRRPVAYKARNTSPRTSSATTAKGKQNPWWGSNSKIESTTSPPTSAFWSIIKSDIDATSRRRPVAYKALNTSLQTSSAPKALPNSPSTSKKAESKDIREAMERIITLEGVVNNLTNLVQQLLPRRDDKKSEIDLTLATKPPRDTHIGDCSEIKSKGLTGGVFHLKSFGRLARCTDKGELIALSRVKGNIDFNRNWTEYRDGFGNPQDGDYWLGLRHLAQYTKAGDRCMRLEMKPWKLPISDRFASYADVQIGNEETQFKLLYNSFKGNVAKNSLSDMNKRPFSTFDNDNDLFVGNCAATVGGGNWYKFCYAANIFGYHKYLSNTHLNSRIFSAAGSESMCWRGLHSSQGNMCSPLVSVKMIFSRPFDKRNSRKVIYEQIATSSMSCKSRLTTINITSSGLYTVTAGGGSGGMARNGTPGGRGAMVRATLLLKRGKRLAIIVGCGGSQLYDTADGGNATILMDVKSRKPLLVAGGGGGASNMVPGSHGVAEERGGDAWWAKDSKVINSAVILGQSQVKRAANWSTCSAFSEYCTTGGRAGHRIRTERERYHDRHGYTRWRTKVIAVPITGAGGGGGYQGGINGDHSNNAGGGGSSFCDQTIMSECKKIEGGNRHQAGFVVIEKSSCF